MELNREEIIKDLECCKFGKDEAKCKECNWHPWIKPRCWRLLASNALALIKQLTAENEKLKSENKTLEIYNKDYKFKNTELLKFNRRWAKECAELQDECDQIKENAILKMQNKILALSTYGTINISSWQLEQVAKELLEA